MADTILLVEDDASILRGLELNLRLEGFRTLTARDGEEGLRIARRDRPDLIVLDMMMPKVDGMEFIRAFRAEDLDTPIVVLSARGSEADKVFGLSSGADDYVAKPFGVAELVARIRAALRRRRRAVGRSGAPAENGDASGDRYAFGQVRLDIAGRRIVVDGVEVESTAREFDLLRFFVDNPNVVFSREQLMHKVWGPDHYGTVRTVDNFVARLRAKVEADPDRPHHIETVRGVGYRFNPDPPDGE
jgi:DNA-binding response OmpR family regulator